MQAGSLNAKGFSSSIDNKVLPHFEHITHAGIYNENFYEVGPKTTKLLDIYYGLGVSNCDLVDLPKRNFFLSLFLKSSKDGEKRTVPINAALTLDVSGSMGGQIKYDG